MTCHSRAPPSPRELPEYGGTNGGACHDGPRPPGLLMGHVGSHRAQSLHPAAPWRPSHAVPCHASGRRFGMRNILSTNG